MTQGAQTGALRPLSGVGGRFKREGTYVWTCGQFMLIHGRNQHNVVKQLSPLKNFFKRVNSNENKNKK